MEEEEDKGSSRGRWEQRLRHQLPSCGLATQSDKTVYHALQVHQTLQNKVQSVL